MQNLPAFAKNQILVIWMCKELIENTWKIFFVKMIIFLYVFWIFLQQGNIIMLFYAW